jgi:large subunit ribosomal protein L29
MRIKELRQKPEKELRELLDESRHKLGQLKFDLASKKLKNHRQIRELHREIARILTILNQKNNEPKK